MAEGKENVIDSYVVKVGFEADDTAGRDFLNTQKEIEQHNKEIDRQSADAEESSPKRAKTTVNAEKERSDAVKSSAAEHVKGNKQKSASNIEYEKTLRQLGRTWREISSGNPIGATIETYKSIQAVKELINAFSGLRRTNERQPSAQPAKQSAARQTETSRKSPAAEQQAETTAEQKIAILKPKTRPMQSTMPGTENAASPKSYASIPAGKDNSLPTALSAINSQLAVANEKSQAFSKTISKVFSDSSAASSEISAEAILSGLVAATGIGLIATATIAATKAVVDMTNSLSEANTDIETMSAKMWITNESAWKLNNTLSAMGKTTSDLNDIALNPTLRKQFEALQEYQKTTLQLPSDFKSVNEEWAESVTLPMEKLSLTNQYMKEMISYDFEKTLITPASRIANLLLSISDSIKDIVEAFDNLGKEITGSAWYKGLTTLFSNIKELNSKYGAAALGEKAGNALSGGSNSSDTATSSSSSTTGSTETSAAEKALQNYNYNWKTIVPSSTSYNTSSSTTNSSGTSVKFESSPSIKIYTNSSDADTIAQRTSNAVSSSSQSDVLVLTHALQGSGH